MSRPLGDLLAGSQQETPHLLKERLRVEPPTCLVAVGDQVTRTVLSLGVKAKLYVVDGKTKRSRVAMVSVPDAKILRVENPPGYLGEEALAAVEEAFRGEESVLITVEGEEDLLTLAAILYAPEGALVIYGQPDEGLVAVRVDKERRRFAEKIFEEMEVVDL